MDAQKYAALADVAAHVRSKHAHLMSEIEAAANRIAAARETYDEAIADARKCGVVEQRFSSGRADPETYTQHITGMKFNLVLGHTIEL